MTKSIARVGPPFFGRNNGLVATGITEPWFLFVAGFWGFGIGTRYSKLWQAGYSWRDVLNRPPAPDAVEAQLPPALTPKALRRPTDVGVDEDFGPMRDEITQLRRDEAAIRQIVSRLPPSERNLLPDVVATVEGLSSRALDLARTLSQMEGEVDPEAGRLLEVTEKALFVGIEQATVGNRLYDISHAIQSWVEAHGWSATG